MRKVIEERKVDYQTTFGSPAGQRVLDDLARICFVTTVDEGVYAAGDPYETAFRCGAHEVFRIISLHLNLTTEQLAKLYMPKLGARND